MTEMDDAIELDLLPAAETSGKLHEQSDDEYLWLSSYKSLFHFAVKPSLRIHGTGEFDEDGSELPASLLMFTIEANPERQARPIKWASIQVTFERDENGSSPDDAPRIERVAPGRPPLHIECTQEKQTNTNTTEASGGAQAGATVASGNLNAKGTKSKAVEKDVTFSTVIQVETRPSKHHKFSNLAKWTFEANASQGSSIAPDSAVVVLLKRPTDGEFVCTVEVNIEVDWLESTKDWFTQFPKWRRTMKWYHFDPKKPITGGREWKVGQMHEYKEKDALRPLWYTNLKEIYKEFKEKEIPENQPQKSK